MNNVFNLEKTIANWEQELRRSPAFEDGDIVELESHLREEIRRLQAEGFSAKEAFTKAAAEIGQPDHLGDELYKTRASQSAGPTPPWKQQSWVPGLLPNHLKVTLRKLQRDKLYAGINIGGLGIGIVCCMLIYLFVRNELNYDTFHENGDRIHRVVRIMHDNGVPRQVGITSAPFADALENDFPAMVEETVRLMPSDGLVEIGDRKFMEDRLYITDADFFEVFSWPLVEGDPERALSRPNTVVLSEATARKYFGSENPLGKILRVDGQQEFEVTGVFRKPENARSHIDFDLLASMETFREANFYSDWWWNALHTYVMLPETGSRDQLQSRLRGFMDKYFADNMAQNNRRIDLQLQPLNEIYFSDETTFDWEVAHGSKTILYMFGVIALLVIITACVNFVNMATARSINHAREIGIRKTLGAERFSLMGQFMGESLLLTLCAGVVSFAVVYLILPWFEGLLGKEMAVSLLQPGVLIPVALFLLLTGLLAGIYPALVLSSFQPIRALKEKIRFGTSQMVVRKGLIISQFVISSLLIAGTLIANRQLDYLNQKSLGFQPDQLINISINNGAVRPHLETMQELMEQIPGVQTSSIMSGTPGGFFDNYLFRAGGEWDETHTLKTLFTDDRFGEVLDVEFLAGRDFDESFATDSGRAVIINEAAADYFQWSPEEALGQRFQNQFLDSTEREVVGVVENFHFESLHRQVAPLVVAMNADRREILVKVETENLAETLASLETVWNEFSPLYPLEYFFLDQQFANLYESDRRQRTVFSAFSMVAVFLACMGLFSLAAFNAERRKKEMGVRKVLGAGTADILLLFNREILTVIGTAFFIAVPAAYLLSEMWLQGYAYRIPNGISNYLLSGVIILVLAVVTVSYQSLKMTRLNPVENLKNE